MICDKQRDNVYFGKKLGKIEGAKDSSFGHVAVNAGMVCNSHNSCYGSEGDGFCVQD